MIANPLIIYNTDIPQSLVDAANYLAARGLPLNVVGVNFTSSGTAEPTFTELGNGTFTVQPGTYRINGVVTRTYDGASILSFMQQAWFLKSLFDAVLMSTYTPLRGYDGSLHRPLVSYLGYNIESTAPAWSGIIPNGRLGCPAAYTSGFNPTFDFTVEMVPRQGGTILEQALTNALAAEQRFNYREPHVLSSTGGPYVAGSAPGFNSAYWPALMSAARGRHVNITYDLCSSAYPCGSSSANDFLNGSVSPPMPIFALCCPFNANGQAGANQGDQNLPGQHVYSSNYAVRSGGWSAHWYSWQWFWAMDFLYNGGSSAFLTVQEPYEGGIRDPKQFLVGMMDQGMSLAECLQTSISPAADSYSSVQFLDHQTVVGDPLYRPYAISAPRPGAGPPPGLFL